MNNCDLQFQLDNKNQQRYIIGPKGTNKKNTTKIDKNENCLNREIFSHMFKKLNSCGVDTDREIEKKLFKSIPFSI